MTRGDVLRYRIAFALSRAAQERQGRRRGPLILLVGLVSDPVSGGRGRPRGLVERVLRAYAARAASRRQALLKADKAAIVAAVLAAVIHAPRIFDGLRARRERRSGDKRAEDHGQSSQQSSRRRLHSWPPG